LGETTSASVCNDAMNVSCNPRMCDVLDDNNFFIFDDESVKISLVSKMPFRKKPHDSMNVRSKSNMIKSLPRTMHKWLPKMQPLAKRIVQICLRIINSGCSKHMAGNRALLTNFVEKFLGMVRFGNNFAVIAGYRDVVIGSMMIKKVYYVEGLGHNLFSVGQFCDKGLEVAFRKSTCFVRNEDGVDLLTSDRLSNLYTIALYEVASYSLTCLLAKAFSSQSWLWHQHLSHLNFVTINNLVKNNLVQGLPKMKFKKDHLCSACEQGKIHQKHHKSKMDFASKKPLYLLHMDLCGPMCVKSINGKRYVLVVVDDYSRYTWVFFLHSKDEASEVIISFIKKTQVNLQIQVQHVRTDNGTKFKNKTLAKFSDEVVPTPMVKQAKLKLDLVRKPVDHTDYRSMIGSLMYVTSSRLDIMFATCICARYQANPNEHHVSTVKRIFHYLKGSINLGLWYLKDSGFDLTTYLDANHAGCHLDRKREEESTNNTNRVNIVTSNINAASSSGVNVVGTNISIDLPPDPNMPSLEYIGIFEDSHDDKDVFGADADFHNLDFTFQVSPILITRIYKDHPLEQVIEDLHSAPQTRRMSNNLEEHGLVGTVIPRTDNKDLQNCLFAYFLSQMEPKKVLQALKDQSWIEAMQEELLQFKL
nr:retrovirus-related Pol polyprotein from transposon TNT 1-94 [Tanacetum cinerariifolium]